MTICSQFMSLYLRAHQRNDDIQNTRENKTHRIGTSEVDKIDVKPNCAQDALSDILLQSLRGIDLSALCLIRETQAGFSTIAHFKSSNNYKLKTPLGEQFQRVCRPFQIQNEG